MESIENIEEEVKETTKKRKKPINVENIDVEEDITENEEVSTDIFETLFKDKDKEVKVLNVYGGCIVNTYTDNSVSSVFVPGNHIKDGKITQM